MDGGKIIWILLYLVMLIANVIAWLIVVKALTAIPIEALWKTLVYFLRLSFLFFLVCTFSLFFA